MTLAPIGVPWLKKTKIIFPTIIPRHIISFGFIMLYLHLILKITL